MKILLLGAHGQLGKELERQLSIIGTVVAFPRALLDITDYRAISNTIHNVWPNIIVNAAAYTAVDKAEDERDIAYAVNAEAVENLAQIAEAEGIWLIHYSTDYVFDGSKPTPYVETDTTNPMNVYGASKLAGEQAIIRLECRHFIFRTTWVVGKEGHNFAKTILRLASERNSLNVICDQQGVPTSPCLIAKVTTAAIQAIKNNAAWPEGIYNLVPQGRSNWHEIAQTLVDCAAELGMPLSAQACDIRAITTAEYPTAAKRPLNSLLDTQRLCAHLSFGLPDWKDDFLAVAGEIIEEWQAA